MAESGHPRTVATPSKISLTVVLPAYNEAENLRLVAEQAIAVLSRMDADWEIVIVDDGSVDGTFKVSEGIKSSHPDRIKTIRHPTNRGYGAALRSGFTASAKELIFFTDADGQFSFEGLPDFIQRLGANDMVLGERVNRKDPWFRKWNSAIGNFLARIVLGIRVRDINCAYKVFRADLIKRLPLKSEGALINTEVLAFAHRLNCSFVQVPVAHFARERGNPTGAKPGVIVKTFAEYFKLRKRMDALVESGSPATVSPG